MHMKLAISAGAALLLLGAIAPVYAQDNHQGDDHNKSQQGQQQGQQHQQAPPAQQQHQQAPPQHQQPASRPTPKPQEHYGGAYHGGVQPTEPTHGGVHPSGVPQHSGQVHDGFQQSRSHSWNTEHRGWGQRGGYNGYRIPDDRFRQYFGGGHFFRISRLPMLFVGGIRGSSMTATGSHSWIPGGIVGRRLVRDRRLLSRLGWRRILPLRFEISRHGDRSDHLVLTRWQAAARTSF